MGLLSLPGLLCLTLSFTTYAGTPKTLDNTMEKLWTRSSQGEWVIPCPSCRHENISSVSEDLINMIGPPGSLRRSQHIV